MINLLPPQRKKELLQEEQWKLVLILGIFAFIFLIALALILLSIRIYISGEVEAQKILFEQKQKEFESPKIQGLRDNLTTFNQKLSRLNAFYQEQPEIAESIEKISQVLPPGVYLTSLTVVRQSAEESWAAISLNGFSSTRERLLDFKNELEAREFISQVYFPPDSWTKKTDITFTVNFKIQ